MTIVREQIDETGTLRIHTMEGCEVVWEFLGEDGLTPDPTPPTTLRFGVETGFSKLLSTGAQPHLFILILTKVEAEDIRAAATSAGQTKPRNVRWAVADESSSIPQTIWEGIVEWDGW